MLPVAPPVDAPARSSKLRTILALSILAIALLGVVVPLVMALTREKVDLSQLTPDPGMRGQGFGPRRGQMRMLTPEQVTALRQERMRQQEAQRTADGVTRRGSRIVVQRDGITADVIRARGGTTRVRFGYNGLHHPEESIWLLARQRQLSGTLNLNPALTPDQTTKLEALGAENAVTIDNPAVHEKLLALASPLLNAPAGTDPSAPPAPLPPVSVEVTQQLMTGLGELTDAQREQLRSDFVRRATAFRDLLTPEQQAQVRASAAQ